MPNMVGYKDIGNTGMHLKGLGIILLLAILPQITHAGETLYIQSVKAKLMSAPSFQAETLEVMDKGSSIEAIESGERWIKVGYHGKQGWVNRLLVAAKPPLKKITVLDEQAVSQEARRRASSVATSAAARGLTAEDRTRLNEKNGFDYEAVSRMESMVIDESEVWRFLDEGNMRK